jgi:hypothetical protein
LLDSSTCSSKKMGLLTTRSLKVRTLKNFAD